MVKGGRRAPVWAAALSAAAGIALLFWPAGEGPPSPAALYGQMALQELLLVGVPALLLLYRRDGKLALSALGRLPGLLPAGLTALAGVGSVLAGAMVSLLWFGILHSLGYTPRQISMPDPGTVLEYLAAFAGAGLIPAVSEELMFRGLILPRLLKKRDALRASLLCGLIFALFHLSLEGFLLLTLIGAFLSGLALKSGGLFLPVLFHLVYNVTVIAMNALGYLPSFPTVMAGTVLFGLTARALLKKEGFSLGMPGAGL